jgi:hypothetical protein
MGFIDFRRSHWHPGPEMIVYNEQDTLILGRRPDGSVEVETGHGFAVVNADEARRIAEFITGSPN